MPTIDGASAGEENGQRGVENTELISMLKITKGKPTVVSFH